MLLIVHSSVSCHQGNRRVVAGIFFAFQIPKRVFSLSSKLQIKMEIQHFSHEHELTLCEDSRKKFKGMMARKWRRSMSRRSYQYSVNDEQEEDLESDEQEKVEEASEYSMEEIEGPICNGCNLIIDSTAYLCESCNDFWLHESCSSLPREIQHHPLHVIHPPILVAKPPEQMLHKFPFSVLRYFICQGCKDISPGFAYYCSECQFTLDVKCALLDDAEHQRSMQVEIKSEIYHSSHGHVLILLNSPGLPKYDCCGCELQIHGLVYGCIDCLFYLHKSCAEIPQEIQHPYHTAHPLSLQYNGNRSSRFICDGCRGISNGFVFQCQQCDVKLDANCALLTDSSLGNRSEESERNAQISHFSHRHVLLPLTCREEQHLECSGCMTRISGHAYGCLACEFYLHKSCAEFPRDIKHSYHPLHPLRAQLGKYAKIVCVACRTGTANKEIVYMCFDCNFGLHLVCAKFNLGVTPCLKHKCHEHNLQYSVGQATLLGYRFQSGQTQYGEYVCNACGRVCRGPSYICLECRSSFHLECIPIPHAVFKPDFHMHSLALKDPLPDGGDDSKEYYCFTCEKERNPEYHAYYCDQCPYTAHIECMVSELAEEEYYNSAWAVNNVDKTAEEKEGDTEYPALAVFTAPRCRKQSETRDFSNYHNMVCHEIDFFPQKQCYQCKLDFFGTAYTCEFCNISFHKVCAELPPKIRHPLHLLHPLILFKVRLADEYYKCDGCISISRDTAYYRCEDCKFILDIECASIGDWCPKLEERKGNSTISIFSHWHSLTLANCPEEIFRRCPACSLYIAGPAYCCLECKFFIHESCSEAPREIQHHQFHPQHPLKWGFFGIASACRACNLRDLHAFAYYCFECQFYIHFTCANYQTSTLKYKNHEHSLFCFEAQDLGDLGFIKSGVEDKVPCNFRCEICREYCDKTFYRCLECDLNFHLECIPVPKIIQGACHIHPLTLVDSVVQDYFHEQYCYACEDVRNPSHAVYYCEKCIYIAHIGCVLNEADTSLEVLAYSAESSMNENLETEVGKTSEKVNCEAILLTISPQDDNASKKGKKEQPAIAEVEGEEIERLEQDMKSLKSN